MSNEPIVPLESIESVSLNVPGTLGLNIEIARQAENQVAIQGMISFKLSQALHSAFQFLPFGLGKQLSNQLIEKQLTASQYIFKVANLALLTCDVSSGGVMTLQASYPSFLAKPVTEGETQRIFQHFSRELHGQGLQPSSHGLIDNFLSGFNKGKGQLDFLGLFEGRTLVDTHIQHGRISALQVAELELRQDELGDLEVHFKAQAVLIDH